MKNILSDSHIFQACISLGRSLESIMGDWLMNVNTRGSVHFSRRRGKNSDAFDFETSAHTTIGKTIRLIDFKENDTVCVLGCGKGRAVCHFARQKVRKVIGVELDRELSEIAKKNAQTLRGRRAEIEIINGDASQVDMSEGTVFFLFNPFGEATMRAVLKNIEKSHDPERMSLTIIYARPLYCKVFKEFPWLRVCYDYTRLSGLHVMIFESGSSQCGTASTPIKKQKRGLLSAMSVATTMATSVILEHIGLYLSLLSA